MGYLDLKHGGVVINWDSIDILRSKGYKVTKTDEHTVSIEFSTPRHVELKSGKVYVEFKLFTDFLEVASNVLYIKILDYKTKGGIASFKEGSVLKVVKLTISEYYAFAEAYIKVG